MDTNLESSLTLVPPDTLNLTSLPGLAYFDETNQTFSSKIEIKLYWSCHVLSLLHMVCRKTLNFPTGTFTLGTWGP